MALQQDSVERHLRVYGPKNIGTINSMLDLGELQRDTGQYDAALKTLRGLMAIEQRVLDPDQGEMAATKCDLASILVKRGKTAEALTLLEDAIDHLPPRIAGGLESDPLFASLHGDPRFVALVARAKSRVSSQKPQ